MGRLTVKSKLLRYSPINNYPEHEITDYIYCDKCGSFYVEDYTAGSGLLKIAAGILIAALVAVVGYAIVNFSQGIPSTSMLYGIPAQLLECLGGSICVIFVPFIMFNIWMLKAAEAGHNGKI